MTKQIKRVRTSKKGKKFLAGSMKFHNRIIPKNSEVTLRVYKHGRKEYEDLPSNLEYNYDTERYEIGSGGEDIFVPAEDLHKVNKTLVKHGYKVKVFDVIADDVDDLHHYRK